MIDAKMSDRGLRMVLNVTPSGKLVFIVTPGRKAGK
jgi:hypothetical protein